MLELQQFYDDVISELLALKQAVGTIYDPRLMEALRIHATRADANTSGSFGILPPRRTAPKDASFGTGTYYFDSAGAGHIVAYFNDLTVGGTLEPGYNVPVILICNGTLTVSSGGSINCNAFGGYSTVGGAGAGGGLIGSEPYTTSATQLQAANSGQAYDWNSGTDYLFPRELRAQMFMAAGGAGANAAATAGTAGSAFTGNGTQEFAATTGYLRRWGLFMAALDLCMARPAVTEAYVGGGGGGGNGTGSAPSGTTIGGILGSGGGWTAAVGAANGRPGGSGFGGGGGAGSNHSTGTSKVGGAGGGILLIVCRRLNNEGTISANGDNGQNGAANSGGTGGGGGGCVVVAYEELIATGTITANGGTAGTAGTGANSRAGGNGGGGAVTSFQLPVSIT